MRTRAFLSDGARLFDLAPIERVRLRGVEAAALTKLAAAPALAKVGDLALHGTVSARGVTALASSGYLKKLKGLDVDGCGIGVAGLEILLAACPSLKWLTVSGLTNATATLVGRVSKTIVVRTRTKSMKGDAVVALAKQGRVEHIGKRWKNRVQISI
jgi:hypothetical protein